MNLDVDFVRSFYPVFQDPQRGAWAFFENAGGSYVPGPVTERLHSFFRDYKVQPYGPFDSSMEAGQAMDAGYDCIAQLLNVPVDQVTLGPSTTMNLYVLAQALRPSLEPGDEVIVTNQDHEANIGCWTRLSEFGVTVKCWPINSTTGELNLEDLQSLVSSKTRAVCFSLCSNIVGSIQDAPAVAAIAHRVGALAIADGVSFAPHRVVDVEKLGVDVYVFSTYKTFGTHVGAMWIKPCVLEHLTCQGHYFNGDQPHYAFNPCGPQHAQIAALAGIQEYLDRLDEHHFDHPEPLFHKRASRLFELIAEHETVLADRVLEVLAQLPDVRMIGQASAAGNRRAPTISFVSQRMRPGELARALATEKIAVRNGHFYALRCLEALGIEDTEEGVLRVSLVHYNTHAEVERLCAALKRLLG